MSYSRISTAEKAINRALLACGMSKVADPYTSTDPAVVQMCSLLNDCLDELASLREWPHLMQEHTITVALGDTGEYPFPDDYDRMVEQTAWSKTDAIPLGGPVSPQIWQQFKNSDFTSNFYIYFREEEDHFWTWPQPPQVGKVINFKYASRRFVLRIAGGGDYSDTAVAAGDVIRFDGLMVSRLLKLRFLEARGFDTAAAENQFNQIFDARAGQSINAPILNLAYRPTLRLISVANIPESGYGK